MMRDREGLYSRLTWERERERDRDWSSDLLQRAREIEICCWLKLWSVFERERKREGWGSVGDGGGAGGRGGSGH